MSQPKHRLHSAIRDALNATGLLWSLQPGRKHMKLYLGGRYIAALPRKPDDGAVGVADTLANIRREARSITGSRT